MRINESGLRIRFVERDYLFNLEKSTSKYITDEQIYDEIDKQPNLCDITFIFIGHRCGFATRIIDNNTNTKISLDDLNLVAFDFYIKQTELISIMQEKARKAFKAEQEIEQRVDKCIKKIKDILYKWDDERKVKSNKFQTAQ